MKIVAIIQARMTSSRLPGKVMADVGGRPMLYYVVGRALRAGTLHLVTVATTDRGTDDPVEAFCKEAGVPSYRGSEDDVLDRYYGAARYFDADVIVRLTADCPLLDPATTDRVVRVFMAGDYDYVSNSLVRTYPDGLDTEVFRRGVLERAWREARLKSEREHVTPYIWKQPDLFRLADVKHDEDLSPLRWTVDTADDLEFVRRVYGYLGSKPFAGMGEILEILRNHPELTGINARFNRNEGYEKSLCEDVLLARREDL